MASYWNARQLLDVYPQEAHFTCVGTTLQGLRCRQSYLRNFHKAEADRILESLPEELRARPTQLFPILRQLAWLTLCPRWHQSGAKCQADTVAARWLQIITSSIPATTTYAYGGYQAPTTLPLSPPQSPLPQYPVLYAPAPSSQIYHLPVILQPSPPVSPSQQHPRATPQNGNGTSNGSILPQISSSIRTINRDGSRRIDINFSIVVDQPIQSNTTARAPVGVHAARSVSGQENLRNQTSSDHPRSNQSSTNSRVSSSTFNRLTTLRDLQDVLARLESLERQAARVQSRSNSTSGSSSPLLDAPRDANSDPRSPIGSTSSGIYHQLPLGHPNLYFSPPRSPAPIPHAGSLSISTDSRSTSSVVDTNTPSSRASTPAVNPPVVIPATLVAGTPGPVVPHARVQRRPITDCYICGDDFQSPEDAVWCRGTCGQNVHLHCCNLWFRTQASFGLPSTCGLCRQPWVF